MRFSAHQCEDQEFWLAGRHRAATINYRGVGLPGAGSRPQTPGGSGPGIWAGGPGPGPGARARTGGPGPRAWAGPGALGPRPGPRAWAWGPCPGRGLGTQGPEPGPGTGARGLRPGAQGPGPGRGPGTQGPEPRARDPRPHGIAECQNFRVTTSLPWPNGMSHSECQKTEL